MNRTEYLKQCIINKKYKKLGWMVSIFSYIGNQPIEKLEHLDLSYEANGYNYYDKNLNKLVLLEDGKDTPLFTPRQPIVIDKSWLPIVEDTTDTTVGRLLTNAVVINEPFRSVLPYINKQFSVSTIENIVAPIVLSDPSDGVKEPNKIYISDYLKSLDNAQYISNLSSTVVISASEKIITTPKGLDEYMETMIKKYEGKLDDPVELVRFENEIKAFDNDYLKDDASYGLFISGKIRDNARAKMFLLIGSSTTLDERRRTKPILTSLAKGWNLNVDDFTSMINELRSGSYMRSKETIKGGTLFKSLIRSGNAISVKEGDCGTTLTIARIYSENNISKLINRNIVDHNRIVHIDNREQAMSYKDKVVHLRTPLYCKESKDKYCSICTGSKIYNDKNNMISLLLEISSIVTKSSLKAFHSNVLSVAQIDIEDNFS